MEKEDKGTRATVGVIGAGSFGTAIANLLAENVDVLLFSRHPQQVEAINRDRANQQIPIADRVTAIGSYEAIANQCQLIFPIVPSENFRNMMRQLASWLRPFHILIHGTKGLDITGEQQSIQDARILTREQVHTMSEVILQESSVLRVGCLSGPNLSAEISAGQPAATVIGSPFDEVVNLGQRYLQSKRFRVFGTRDMLGAELAGAFKNAIAIGSGILTGMGLGKNMQALLITRGLTEMIYFGKALGAASTAFLGTAGIGDLVATATSDKSRNFTFGYHLAQGKSLEQINREMPELAEGVRTIKTMRLLGRHYDLHVPITEMLHSVVFEGIPPKKALDYLMTYPYDVDVDFL